MYTGTVRPMAEVDIEYTLKAKDLFKDPFLITSDDARITYVEKSEPDGWHLMGKELEQINNSQTKNMIAFEDRASGALGALKTDFKYVIIVPDKNDAPEGFDPSNFSSYWDKNNLIQNHLQSTPRDIERMIFLNSLESITY
jgi:beta-phosphoglucomutase-like phosphatase (HAD superfamily)